MADEHTALERRLKTDINRKNRIRRDMKKSMSPIRCWTEKLARCKNLQRRSRYTSSIKRHREEVERLRVELLRMDGDLEKRIKGEMEYSEKEVEEFEAQLKKEIKDMEEARAKLEKVKANRSKETDDVERITREMVRASNRLIKETADVKHIEKELTSEERDKILFTRELKRIRSEKAIYAS